MKADRRVEVKTLHSLGYALIKRVWPNAKPDNDIETERVKKSVLGIASENRRSYRRRFETLFSFAKNTIINPTVENLAQIVRRSRI